MKLHEKYPALYNFAFLPDRLLDVVRSKIGKNYSRHKLLSFLNDCYIVLQEGEGCKDIIFYNNNNIVEKLQGANKVYLFLKVKIHNEEDYLVLLFKPNSRANQQPWELTTVLTEKEYNSDTYFDLGNISYKKLFNFSYWPTFNDDLRQLANLALQENWSLQAEQDEADYSVLKSYLEHTFAKLFDSNMVSFSKDKNHAVFNTGLVNRNYKYIYVIFEKQLNAQSPYRFLTFDIPGIGFEGRQLANFFDILPMPARYFNDISDISYILQPDKNPDEQMPELQIDHYIVEHPERFPISFLLDGCRKSPELCELLVKDLTDLNEEKISSHWKKVGEMILYDQLVYDDLEASLRHAVRKAVMRVSWNYKTAIPIYFPARKKMSILLPLSFTNDNLADVALVVERSKTSKKYYAPTILDLGTAYSNARLVCKPESDWLNQKTINSKLNEAMNRGD